MSLFSKKIITFGGGRSDLVWMYDASADSKVILVAQAPYEIVYIKNGAVDGVFHNQKIEHSRPLFKGKDSIDKYYFVNVQMPCQTQWGTAKKLEYQDAQSGQIIAIGANGIISFCIADSRKFIERVLGARAQYAVEDLANEMLAKVFDDFNEQFLSVLQKENITYSRMDSMLKEIGAIMLPAINASLEKYGVRVAEFIIRQLVKPEELKERANKIAEKADEFDQTLLETQRRLALLKAQEEIENQKMQMNKARSEHTADLARIDAQAEMDIEKMGYEAKGVTYKELRELDREDVTVAGDALAKVAEAVKNPEETVVVVKTDNTGVCPYCDGTVTAGQIFCPTCKKKIV